MEYLPPPPARDDYPRDGFYVADRRFPPLPHAPERGWHWGRLLDGPVTCEREVAGIIHGEWEGHRHPTPLELRVWLILDGEAKDVTDHMIAEVRRISEALEDAE
jgi:hypothetical protein